MQVGKDTPKDVLDDLLGVDDVDQDSPPEVGSSFAVYTNAGLMSGTPIVTVQNLSATGDLAAKVTCMIKEIRRGFPVFAPLEVTSNLMNRGS